MAYLEVSGLTKSFGEGSGKVEVLRGVAMTVEKGEMCTILGPSGSGKSTLLNVIGGLDGADGGKILIDGNNLVGLDAEELSAFRRDYLGFVFQFYNLVPNLTVLENIEVGEYLSDDPLDMEEILNVLGLEELKTAFRMSFRAANSSAVQSGVRSSKTPSFFSAMNRPVRSTTRPPKTFWPSSSASMPPTTLPS